MKNVAVILAGGKGLRLGNVIPKQFLEVSGRMVIEHTIEVFQTHTLIDEIAVVVNKDYIQDIEEIVVKNGFSKLKRILVGGAERYHSSLAAIEKYKEEVNLIFHDAVRPLVNHRIITDCIKALEDYNAVGIAVHVADTIFEVEGSIINNVPNRNRLRRAQTPQAFKLSTIRKAYEIGLKDPDFNVTEDCGVVSKYLPEESIYIVEGEQYNIKLTYKEDLFLLDKLFQMRKIDGDINDFEMLIS